MPDPSPLAPGTVSYSMSFTCSTTPTSRVPLLRYSIASTTLPPHPQEVRRRAHTREDPYIQLRPRHVLHNSRMRDAHARPTRKWKPKFVLRFLCLVLGPDVIAGRYGHGAGRACPRPPRVLGKRAHATTRDYAASTLAPARSGNRASCFESCLIRSSNAIAERQGHADAGVGGTTTRSRCSCGMDTKRNGRASEQRRRERGREQRGSAQTRCGLRTRCGHRVASRKGCSSDASMRVRDGMGAAAQTGAARLHGGSGRRTGRARGADVSTGERRPRRRQTQDRADVPIRRRV
ncbi:hypothetical protein B0H14DRAFT_2774288, partial [Mycena olivaceomarginata]